MGVWIMGEQAMHLWGRGYMGWKHKCLMAPSELRSYMQPGGLRVSLSRGFPRKLEAEMEHSCPTPAKDSGK